MGWLEVRDDVSLIASPVSIWNHCSNALSYFIFGSVSRANAVTMNTPSSKQTSAYKLYYRKLKNCYKTQVQLFERREWVIVKHVGSGLPH
jgi:hypothetical protein